MIYSKEGSQRLKLIVLGDTQTGKTSLIDRIVYGQRYKHELTSIFSQNKTRFVKHNNSKVYITFWDRADQIPQKSAPPSLLRRAGAVIICYSINDPTTFSSLSDWIELLKRSSDSQIPCYIVGCKSDLKNNILEDQVQQLTRRTSLKHYLTSAKTGEGVTEMITSIVDDVLTIKTELSQEENTSESIVLVKEDRGSVIFMTGVEPLIETQQSIVIGLIYFKQLWEILGRFKIQFHRESFI